MIVNRYSGTILLLAIYSIFAPHLSTSEALAQRENTDAFVEQGAQRFRSLLLESMAQLKPYMKPRERKILKNIKIHVNAEQTVADVRAEKNEKTAGKVIQFNAAAELKYMNAADAGAMILTKRIKNKESQDVFLYGYLRYIANGDKFFPILSPKMYAEYYRIELSQPSSPREILHQKNIEAFVRKGFIEFLLAHEIGHHVLDHIDGIKRTYAEIKKQEIAADRWAIDLLIRSKNIPMGALFFGLLANEMDERSLENANLRKHPSGLDRSIKIITGIMDGIKIHRKKLEENSKVYGLRFNYKETIIRFFHFRRMLEKKRSLQNKLDQDKKHWLKLAENGDIFAQLKVANYYFRGRGGYPLDITRSAHWYKEAADNDSNYDYFSSAKAKEFVGAMYVSIERYTKINGLNIPDALKYAEQSANMNYFPGKFTHFLIRSHFSKKQSQN